LGSTWRTSTGGLLPEQQAEAKNFVLRVIDLALSRYRWDELLYDPPLVQGHLRQYRDMVEVFDPLAAGRRGAGFPTPAQAATASCVRHRVLSRLPLREGCVFDVTWR
jgi:hypothetical protein